MFPEKPELLVSFTIHLITKVVRTNTLTKSAVVQIDATPFRQWYENHYGATLGKRRVVLMLLTLLKLPMPRDQEKSKENWLLDLGAAIESAVDSQFGSGRLYAVISSRPGQSGRCDGYILKVKN